MEKKDLITLKQLPGIGDGIINKILKEGFENIEDFCDKHQKYTFGIKDISKFNKALENIELYTEKSLSIMDDCVQKDIKIITVKDKNYPIGLKRIGSSPTVLYCKSKNPENLTWPTNIAIVGTRNCTENGRGWAFKAAKKLTEKGYNIISGLANGIDTAAHKGSLDVGLGKGITTAVITNINEISKSKIELSEEIINHDGILLSENPPNTKFQPSQLILRNRIQTGMSDYVIVVECPEKGGTISTISFAQKQKKPIFIPDWDKIEPRRKVIPELYTINKLLSEGSATPINQEQLGIDLSSLVKDQQRLFQN